MEFTDDQLLRYSRHIEIEKSFRREILIVLLNPKSACNMIAYCFGFYQEKCFPFIAYCGSCF